jgi:hypothetical protein
VLAFLKAGAPDPESITLSDVDERPHVYEGQPVIALSATVRGRNGFGVSIAKRRTFIVQGGNGVVMVVVGDYAPANVQEVNSLGGQAPLPWD